MNKLIDGIDAYQQGDYDRAMQILLPLAEEGNAKAQCHVASMYQAGLGVTVDGHAAVKWYRRAAEQEDRSENISGVAYHNLAMIFTTGLPGVSPDPRFAKEYLRRASDLGVELVPRDWWQRGKAHS